MLAGVGLCGVSKVAVGGPLRRMQGTLSLASAAGMRAGRWDAVSVAYANARICVMNYGAARITVRSTSHCNCSSHAKAKEQGSTQPGQQPRTHSYTRHRLSLAQAHPVRLWLCRCRVPRALRSSH